MRVRHLLTMVLLLVATWPGAASAQPVRPIPPPPAPPGPGSRLRARVKKMIDLWRMNKIVGLLNLSTAQAPKFFAEVNRYERKLRPLRQQNQRIIHQIKKMVQANRYQAAKVNRLVSIFMKNQIKIKQLEYQRYQAVARIISAQQLAKLMLALPRIERQIKRMIRKAQRRHRRGGGWWAAPPGSPLDPFGPGR